MTGWGSDKVAYEMETDDDVYKVGCGKFVKKSNDFFYHCGDLNKYFCEECSQKTGKGASK